MTLESFAEGEICQLKIDKRELIDNDAGLEKIPLNFSTVQSDTGKVDLSRFRAAPIAHLCSLCFEGQGAFPAEC